MFACAHLATFCLFLSFDLESISPGVSWPRPDVSYESDNTTRGGSDSSVGCLP